MANQNKPYTISELNKRVEAYRRSQENRVHNYRIKRHTEKEKKSTKTDRWDMPLTVCSCGSTKAPFIAENGRNCSALKTPDSVIQRAYQNIRDNSGKVIGSIPLGSHPNSAMKKALGYSKKDSYAAGRCAEPHAANRLLNTANKVSKAPVKIEIDDLLFSVALDARYPVVKPYCVTCKCAFPQLR